MMCFIKFFFKLTEDEVEILKAIEDLEASGIKSMRVVGLRTLTVDVEDVMQSDRFKEYQNKARGILLKGGC